MVRMLPIEGSNETMRDINSTKRVEPAITVDPTDREALFIIAARAKADPRSVAKVARGERVRGDVYARIVRAAREVAPRAA